MLNPLTPEQILVRETILLHISKALDRDDHNLLYVQLGTLGSKFHEVISTIFINLGTLGAKFFCNSKATRNMTVIELIRHFEHIVFSTFWERGEIA